MKLQYYPLYIRNMDYTAKGKDTTHNEH